MLAYAQRTLTLSLSKQKLFQIGLSITWMCIITFFDISPF